MSVHACSGTVNGFQEGGTMMDEAVKHVKYGAGKVTDVNQDRVTVIFDGMAGEKVFRYPDAFERFLRFEDPCLQLSAESAVLDIKKRKKEEEKQRLVLYQLYEARRKQEQSDLLKKRRKAARERQAREKMAKVI